MKILKTRLVPLLACIAGLCISLNTYSQHADILVKEKPELLETVYRAFAGDKREISLTTYQTKINKGVLHLRSKSDSPLPEQLDILSNLLDKMLKREQGEMFQTLFIGRLINAFGESNTQMAERLSIASFNSPLWDSAKGKPVTGHENFFVQSIANKARIFGELQKVFKRHGYTIKISGVEKVLIGRPDQVRFGESLLCKRVLQTDRLPYDGLTWFSLSQTGDRVYLGGGYWKDDEGVYWKWRTIKDTRSHPRNRPIRFVEKSVIGADPDTFMLLAERVEGIWGKDKSGIYFFHEKMKGVDAETWEPYDWGYSKDKNYVYKGSSRIIRADPGTFQIPITE